MSEENTLNSPENIIKRLNSLRLWQEEQQKLLFERQNNQKQKLSDEQQKMYESFGLASSSPPNKNKKKLRKSDLEDGISYLGPLAANNIDSNQSFCDVRKEKDFEKVKISDDLYIKKQPFLKRGEGLTNRFKVHPNTFRLGNLPKYKYANTHKQLLAKSKPTGSIENKKLITKPKELLKTTELLKLVPNTPLITDREHFFSHQISHDENTIEKFDSSISTPTINQKHPHQQNKPISWAKVLDPTHVKAVEMNEIRVDFDLTQTGSKMLNDSDTLSIFELLEQKSQEDNISLNASNIRKWIQQKAIALVKETEAAVADQIEIDRIKKTNLLPYPCDIDSNLIAEEDEDEDEDDDNNDVEVSEKDLSISSDDRSSYDKNKMQDQNQNRQHVRFSDDVKVNEVESETETVQSFEIVQIANNTPAPSDMSDFARFKSRLFAGTEYDESILMDGITTNSSNQLFEINNDQREEINEKSELLKQRLCELESEIINFKQNNLELMKLKQNHELQKVQLDQEYLEMQEKINDDKIKMEIFLHDEKMKIEDEKNKLKKLIKDQRTPNRKERDEILKLREQVENLQKDNKFKEGKHISAQSRLRAQIRNLEKELKDSSYEIEHLKKENKKIESENSKLSRLNNNKMLQEINKSIAKLAPQPNEPPIISEVRNRNMKPVVARVVAHKKPSKASNSNHLNNRSESSVEDDDEQLYLGKSSEDDESSNNHRKMLRKKKTLHRHISPEYALNKENASNDSYNKKEFKREIQNSDGSKDIWYPNGNLKKISADGMNIRMLYFNKDIKETNICEGTVKYYYAETNTWHTTYLDGLEILEFPNGETEHRYKDGTVEVHFSNGSIRISNPLNTNTTEEWRYSDGTNLIKLKNGDQILSLPNGQKEIHTKIHKRREYPDGTIKLVYPDGSQETRYSNGRIRLKDNNGQLVMDSENIKY